jgi:hypothetical protein
MEPVVTAVSSLTAVLQQRPLFDNTNSTLRCQCPLAQRPATPGYAPDPRVCAVPASGRVTPSFILVRWPPWRWSLGCSSAPGYQVRRSLVIVPPGASDRPRRTPLPGSVADQGDAPCRRRLRPWRRTLGRGLACRRRKGSGRVSCRNAQLALQAVPLIVRPRGTTG